MLPNSAAPTVIALGYNQHSLRHQYSESEADIFLSQVVGCFCCSNGTICFLRPYEGDYFFFLQDHARSCPSTLKALGIQRQFCAEDYNIEVVINYQEISAKPVVLPVTPEIPELSKQNKKDIPIINRNAFSFIP